jgi:hypothetical protein
MANVVNLTPETLRRIIQEEKEKIVAEARKKAPKTEGSAAPVKAPANPTVKGGKKSSVPKQVEASNGRARKAMQLDEREVEAADMAETLSKQVKHLKEMRDLESRLREKLRLVVESRTALEKKLTNLL